MLYRTDTSTVAVNLILRALALVGLQRSLRKPILALLEKGFYRALVQDHEGLRPKAVLEDQFRMLRNIIWAVDKALDQQRLSQEVFPRFLSAFSAIWLEGREQRRAFKRKYGHNPPAFLTISPTKRCNLQCVGCYANSSRSTAETLDYAVVDRVIHEKTALWGSHFTVLSGGEPMLYRSRGKTIFDLCREHRDNLFLMYTNGTLINEKNAEKLAEVGNLTPAISVEGFERETDARRGEGVHAKIRQAFQNLRNVGVPYGISITATRHNADLVISDAFLDYYFEEMGATYAWIFQYMPIGRRFTLDLMVTPEQRIAMWQKERELINDRGLFIADFWNCGTVSNGCISAGKETSGYLYIDWNGNVMPCVFNPYYTHNIVQVYAEGGDLNTVLFTPMMETIRKWHRSYVLERPPHKVGNILCQCAIRDHYQMMRRILERFKAQPEDTSGSEALQDPEYYRGMVEYGKQLRELTDPIWEKVYIEPEKQALH